MKSLELLLFIKERFVNVYKEHPNTDYLIALKNLADEINDKDEKIESLSKQNDELVAQIENLKSAVRAVQSVPKRSGFAVNDPNPKAEMIAWMKLNQVMSATPAQHLRDRDAEVVNRAAKYLVFAIDSSGKAVDALHEYAEKVRRGEV